jgi:hypothetical protein
MHLGRTVSTRYLGPDARFHRSWLVFEEDNSLVGGAGMRASRTPNGALLLELWLFDRHDASEVEPPMVALATPAAAAGAVAAGWPESRVVAAVAGRHVTLETDALNLRGVIAEAVVDGTGMGFQTLTLDLSATRNQRRKGE